MAHRPLGLSGRAAALVVALGLPLAACGGAPPKKAAVVTPGKPSTPVPPPPAGPPVLPSFVVADVTEETASFFARQGELGLVVFPTAGKLRAQLVGLADETPVSKGAPSTSPTSRARSRWRACRPWARASWWRGSRTCSKTG
jgi:hypothetical protein